MNYYIEHAKEFIDKLDYRTQQKAAVAIKDLLDNGKDWEWIDTALHKKSVGDWEQWGFGLMFNQNFNISVLQQIERNEKAREIDVEEFFGSISER